MVSTSGTMQTLFTPYCMVMPRDGFNGTIAGLLCKLHVDNYNGFVIVCNSFIATSAARA